MKESPPAKRNPSAQRQARVAAVVAKAKTRGEKVPRGVKLIGFRNATSAERAHARKLIPLARQVHARNRSATA